MDTQTDEQIETTLHGYAGRPLKFHDIDEVNAKLEAYFEQLDPHWVEYDDYIEERYERGKHKGDIKVVDGAVQYRVIKRRRWTDAKPPTVTGLARALGTTRATLIDYEERGLADGATEFEVEFLNTIKAAKLAVEEYNAQNLASGSVPAAGVIFTMINNHGWKQASEIKTSGEQTVKLERGMTDDELAALVARSAGSESRPSERPGQAPS